jgi:hypothetical protein
MPPGCDAPQQPAPMERMRPEPRLTISCDSLILGACKMGYHGYGIIFAQ